MKKGFSVPFLCGVLTAALISSMAGAAQADETSRVLYNQAGISLYSEEKIAKGDSCTASNGQEVPSVITYVDSKGGKTNYLSVEQIARLLGGVEIVWDEEVGNVDIAPEKAAADASQLIIGVQEEYPSTPEYGEKVGPFTEIDPSQLKLNELEITSYPSPTRMTADTAGVPDLECSCSTENGYRDRYVVYTITNNGTTPETVTVRLKAVLGRSPSFTPVTLPAGKTMTRAFRVDEDAERVQNTLLLGTYPNPYGTDITQSAATYR